MKVEEDLALRQYADVGIGLHQSFIELTRMVMRGSFGHDLGSHNTTPVSSVRTAKIRSPNLLTTDPAPCA